MRYNALLTSDYDIYKNPPLGINAYSTLVTSLAVTATNGNFYDSDTSTVSAGGSDTGSLTVTVDLKKDEWYLIGGRAYVFSSAKSEAPVQPVPEPATMLLLGTGLLGIAAAGRKRFKRS